MTYLPLNELKVYQLSRLYSKQAWEIYLKLDKELKRTIGYQYIKSVDSVGANIAEGYGRYHYLDKIRFYSPSPNTLWSCHRDEGDRGTLRSFSEGWV